MSEIDLEKGLQEFLLHTEEAFRLDASYAEAVARQAMSLDAAKRLVNGVD